VNALNFTEKRATPKIANPKNLTLGRQDFEPGTDHFDNGQGLGYRDFDDGDQDAIDGFFRQEGIYPPACYPKTKGKRSWLAVEKISTIERADLLSLK